MGESIITFLQTVYSKNTANASADANYIAGVIRVACGMGALIYIFSKLIVQIASNQEINFLVFLRPFLILMLIPFSGNMATAIDDIGDKIRGRFTQNNKDIAAQVQRVNKELQERVDEKWKEIRNNPEAYQAMFGTEKAADEKSFFGETLTDLKITIAQAQESFKFQMASLLQDILLALMYVAEAILLLFSIMFRLVLRMGFPIALGLSIFPGFSLSLAEWFGKYLNFALLPAVAAMYSNVCFELVYTYLNRYSSLDAVAAMNAETAQPAYMGLAFIGILIMCLLGYTQIPSMTAMLIHVGGVGALSAAATRSAVALGNKGIRTGDNVFAQASQTGERMGGFAESVQKSGRMGAMAGAVIPGSIGARYRNAVKGAAAGIGTRLFKNFKK